MFPGFMNPEVLKEFGNRGNCRKLVYLDSNLQISLDSVRPHVNERTRGMTELVKRNIEILLDNGVELQIACVVSKHNLDYAGEIIDHYFPRVTRFHFMNLMPTRALRSTAEDPPFPEEAKLALFWRDLQKKQQLLLGKAKLTCPERFSNGTQSLYYPGCSAAVTFCEINTNLEVIPCNIGRVPVLGSLIKDTLPSIWAGPISQWVRALPFPACHPKTESFCPVSL